ncbi:MAG: tripartite tricarboxylate transporter substrate binding protein [Pigmentiphaga sp.]|uniref:Bug family tripartite tricarboxylate transporter substrate binding protein n=1 Tax=Pigmentiphaga sp. TaxID=1977564 RepID=UPI0029AD1CC5|nr:tripartite tricarboxylate transporter substrate binding protein [Pigmentiphaga sp.]MDX3904466.1 tripartite tricarboxylate transporter substrate binding protein [Pigmentiphaga sp.]
MPKYMVRRLLTAVSLIFPCAAMAADYPSKMIRIIVPVPAGGAADTLARIVGEGLQQKWGQSVIVENRSGASGNIGAEAVYRAEPDGHTLLVSPPGPLAINKSLYRQLAYDPAQMVPVSIIAANPNVLLVHPKVPAKSLKELIAYAKAHPGKLNFASGGTGSTPHLAGELLKMMTGIDMVHIPYKGGPPAYADLLAGQVDVMFQGLATALPQIKEGKLRVLAVGGEKRHPALPDVPTLTESLPGFISVSWTGMAAPPGTPPEVAAKLAAAVHDVLIGDGAGKDLKGLDARDLIASNPGEAARFTKEEVERWSKVIRSTGINVD